MNKAATSNKMTSLSRVLILNKKIKVYKKPEVVLLSNHAKEYAEKIKNGPG